ncbi:MAG TPA: YXWGXW repeat-containing protein [Polyangiaceae bacterium]
MKQNGLRVAAAAACFVACGSSTELAPRGTHPPHVQEFVLVDFPPPPAQVEEIPESIESAPDCVWVDGHYAWEDRRFAWHPGQWVMPAEGCYYAPAVTAWSRTGEPRLYYTPPRWYREDALGKSGAAALCPVPRTCVR